MSVTGNPFLAFSLSDQVASEFMVKQIAAISQPVLRNLLITQCYCELSTAFSQYSGQTANWCSFATWASKQAGQTIRNEDMERTLEAWLEKQTGIEDGLSLIATLAQKLGAGQTMEKLRAVSLTVLVKDTASRASQAVSRGNKKVFEEIAFEFARFLHVCLKDKEYNIQRLEEFCKGLRSGGPPDGQELLRKAFSNYYASFFETDARKKKEMTLLANLQIGFHEQTRLQPEIAEALNAAMADTAAIKDQVLATLFKKAGFLTRLRVFFQRLLGKTGLLDKAVEDLVIQIQMHLRQVLTTHLMTLTMPPGNRLLLGKDLSLSYDEELKELQNPQLLALLSRVDPTANSLQQTGATDWANLNERMHYIADLFRCYHAKKEVFTEAFTKEQVNAMKEGKVPEGIL